MFILDNVYGLRLVNLYCTHVHTHVNTLRIHTSNYICGNTHIPTYTLNDVRMN